MSAVPSLPENVAPFAGRILDIDSHEMIPAQIWVEVFGDVVKPYADRTLASSKRAGNFNELNAPDYVGDVREIDPETVWITGKGPNAPAASDMGRRVELMDTMGINRQLMFASGPGHGGLTMYAFRKNVAPLAASLGIAEDEFHTLARRMMDAQNNWSVETARRIPRLRPVAQIYGDTPEELIAVAKSVIDRGIRAVQVAPAILPGGVSAASNALDPFYAMLAEANVALTLHISNETQFLDPEWNNARAFEGFKQTTELLMSPWFLQTYHLAAQNFIGTMVAGGVFDRHPTLRVAVAEFTGHWIGPLAHQLDIWHDNNQAMHPMMFADGSEGRRLPMRPSEYIARNVRVSVFDFEPVGEYIQKNGLEDVYCFMSDYPHTEGGKRPVEKLAASLEPLGQRVMEKFFVTNGELILPE
jgi:Predicted metal-dependent hydrolase of the TIM-barrel fold